MLHLIRAWRARRAARRRLIMVRRYHDARALYRARAHRLPVSFDAK